MVLYFRSPGGTPLPKHPNRLPAASNVLDPQAIIAAALKKKFAHFCSPEKEDDGAR